MTAQTYQSCYTWCWPHCRDTSLPQSATACYWKCSQASQENILSSGTPAMAIVSVGWNWARQRTHLIQFWVRNVLIWVENLLFVISHLLIDSEKKMVLYNLNRCPNWGGINLVQSLVKPHDYWSFITFHRTPYFTAFWKLMLVLSTGLVSTVKVCPVTDLSYQARHLSQVQHSACAIHWFTPSITAAKPEVGSFKLLQLSWV